MKHARFVCLFTFLTSTFLLSQSNPVAAIKSTASVEPPAHVSSISASQPDPKTQAKVLDSYGKLPLSFEANQGQTDGRVKFLSRTGAYSLFLTTDEAVLAFGGKKAEKGKATVSSARPERSRSALLGATEKQVLPAQGDTSVLRMKLRHANPATKVTGVDELAGTSNYFIGNDPAKWRTKVPTYAKVKYEGIYPGVDLVYYGNQRQLEYDFIVAPGADPRRIAFDIAGATRIRRDRHGELVFKMKTGSDEIRWHKPVAYQEKDGTRQPVAAHYAITATNRVGFEVARYDASRPLYIDPLIYSTYLGGRGEDDGYGIAVDSAGNAYITGFTNSADFPTTPGAFQTTCCGEYGDAFVAKLNPSGSALVYSTYLGGSQYDSGTGVAVDSAGNAYVVGFTESNDFPTMNPLQPAYGGGNTDVFVAKINPSGSALVYSTYLGGNQLDNVGGVAVDSAGNAYVTGFTDSPDFPTSNAFQPALRGGQNAFVTKINPAGSAFVYSTYLGGSYFDFGGAIAADSAGNAYVTGLAQSTDFPVTPGAFQTVCNSVNSCANVFVTKLNPAGSALVYSTFLGGSIGDVGLGIAIDSAGDAYVTGYTKSNDFPTRNPFQAANAGGIDNFDGFVTKMNAAGSALLYSTYLGGSGDDVATAIAVDSAGNAYVTGQTYSTDFPTTPGALRRVCPSCSRAGSAFVTRLNSDGSALFYSTYLGGAAFDSGNGIAVDSAGDPYATGATGSNDFPTSNPLQAVRAGAHDAFVSKFHLTATTTTSLSASPNPSTKGEAVTFTAAVTSVGGAPPDGETVTFIKGTKVWATGTLSGGSASYTTSTLSLGNHVITAVYGGDATFLGSTSKPVKQVVNQAGSASPQDRETPRQ